MSRILLHLLRAVVSWPPPVCPSVPQVWLVMLSPVHLQTHRIWAATVARLQSVVAARAAPSPAARKAMGALRQNLLCPSALLPFLWPAMRIAGNSRCSSSCTWRISGIPTPICDSGASSFAHVCAACRSSPRCVLWCPPSCWHSVLPSCSLRRHAAMPWEREKACAEVVPKDGREWAGDLDPAAQ